MKKFRFLAMAFVAVAMMGLVACGDDKEDNSYKDQMVGSWAVDTVTMNGQETQIPFEIIIVMNADGTGVVNFNGETENNDFTWSVDGNKLTVHPHGDAAAVYTINSVTAADATITGNSIPVLGEVEGSVTIHLNRLLLD